MSLVAEVRSTYRAASAKRQKTHARKRAAEEARWVKEQKHLAQLLIKKLPAQLRKAARAPHARIVIYRWEDVRQGLNGDLHGIPAILHAWCKKKGFKVTSSVTREGSNPSYGTLTVYLDEI